jgi:hypothetical protein
MVPTRQHKGKRLPPFEHILLVLIAYDIGLYIRVFPTVLHLVVAEESIQFTPSFSTSSSKTHHSYINLEISPFVSYTLVKSNKSGFHPQTGSRNEGIISRGISTF